MKFEPTRLAEYTDEALLDELRRVANVVGRPSLSTADFKDHARVGLTTLRRRFGGWREALGAAGLAHLYNEVPAARISRTRARGWTADQIVEELRRVAGLLNRQTLTVDDFKRHATIGADAVRARFGTWPKAIRVAGLEPVNHGKRYSDEDCFENLLSVWTHYGRQPRYQEMNASPSIVGGKAYMTRWGTWNRAIHAFTDYVERDGRASGTETLAPVPTDAAPASRRCRDQKTAASPRSAYAIESCAGTASAAYHAGAVPRPTSHANSTSTILLRSPRAARRRSTTLEPSAQRAT